MITNWYSHSTALNEQITELKDELSADVVRNPTVKAFVVKQHEYLELIKHRAITQQYALPDIDLALTSIRQLVDQIKPKNKEIEDDE